ncbi:MAG: trypsin-like peptidase domain-containing protein [Nitrospinales bacterium]
MKRTLTLILILALTVFLPRFSGAHESGYVEPPNPINRLKARAAETLNDAEAYLALGHAYSEAGRSQEAIAAYRDALLINPRNGQAHFQLGSIYSSLGYYQEAVQEFQEAIQTEPGLADAHRLLGDAYCELKQHRNAIAAYKNAIRINPEYAAAYHNLGIVYASLRRHQDALNEFKQASRINPDSPRTQLALAFTYDSTQDGASAIIHALTAEKLYVLKNDRSGIAKSRKSLRDLYEKYGFQPEDFAGISAGLQSFPATVPAPAKTPSERQLKSLSTGTGFLFGSSNHIVTNYHLVKGATRVMVKFVNGERIEADVMAKDRLNDIAFLKLARSPNVKISHIVLGDSSKVRIGDPVFTIGYPISDILGDQPRYSDGVVNSLFGIANDPRVLQISVPIQPGNSGGPLFNARGELIGIAMASLDAVNTMQIIGNVPQNVNFAIKSAFIKNMIPMLPEMLLAPTDIVAIPQGLENSRANFIERMKDNIVLIEAQG